MFRSPKAACRQLSGSLGGFLPDINKVELQLKASEKRIDAIERIVDAHRRAPQADALGRRIEVLERRVTELVKDVDETLPREVQALKNVVEKQVMAEVRELVRDLAALQVAFHAFEHQTGKHLQDTEKRAKDLQHEITVVKVKGARV
jgi:predicted  nucleic acid-binding Zn-ribbon protein